METIQNQKDGYEGNVFQGYFKAPATASYRFYMTCDDVCQLYLGNSNLNTSDISLIHQEYSWSYYRSYFTFAGQHITPWINLTMGDYYYIEAKHIQYSGADHVSVAVEINDPNALQGHHHSMKTYQRLLINQVNVPELTNITINNPDGGQFVLNFVNPKDSSIWQSPTMNTNMSSGDFRNAISTYYSNVFNAPVNVVLTMYNATGAVTNKQAQSTQNVYTISVGKSIPLQSANKISPSSISTRASIVVNLAYQAGTPPLAGSFQIQCTLSDGTLNNTYDIGVANGTVPIVNAITWACPNYREKFEIVDGPLYGWYEDGRELLIRFLYVN